MTIALAPPLSLRPATTADCDWAYRLKRAALKTYIEATWGPWEEEEQRTWFFSSFQPAALQIIQREGSDIGSLEWYARDDHYYIAGIYLLPSAQGQGYGAAVMKQIIRRARADGKPLRLQVLKVNPAQRFYERLGFELLEKTATHFVLEIKRTEAA